jgi:ParB-like chromosome segregation protein Spo0J
MAVKWKKINVEDIIDDNVSVKEPDSEINHKLSVIIKKYGQLHNIIVKRKDDKYIIVDGSAAFKILKKYQDTVICSIIDDEWDEKLISLEVNFGFKNDLVKLANRFKNLLKKYTIQELAVTIPFYENEIEFYPNFLDYDFKKYDLTLNNNLYSQSDENYF